MASPLWGTTQADQPARRTRKGTAVYEACRRMGHAWEQIPEALAERPDVDRDVWLRCTRCTMLRAFDIAPTGEALWPRYYAPQGYRYEGTRGEAPTKADYRIAWLRDIIAARRKADR